MMDDQSKARTPDLRKGIVIFIALLAVIVGFGVYLYQQAEALDRQYDKVEQAL